MLRWMMIAALACLYASANAQIRFEAMTDARQSLAGSPFNVEFRLSNAEGTGFKPPDFGGLQIVGGPSRSMSTTIINGSMTSSTGYVYTLVSTRPGKFTIGPARIKVSGQWLSTQPLTVEIVKGQTSARHQETQTGSEGEIFVKATTDQKEYYRGQQIVVRFKLYTQVNIDNIESFKSELPERCEIEYFSEEFPGEREVINGKEYITKVIGQIALFPLSAGRLIIPAKHYRVIVSDPDPFGFTMKSMFFGTSRVIESNAINLNILDLPSPAPTNFSGAVGTFSAAFSRLNPEYTLSDAIRIQMTIEGDGNFNHIDPRINLQDTLFESMQPSVSSAVRTSGTDYIRKSQSYEFLLSPKAVGEVTMRPSFCYFDPQQKKFLQITDSLTIRITASHNNMLAQKQHVMMPMINKPDTLRMKNQSGVIFWLFLMAPWLIGLIFNFWPVIRNKWRIKKSSNGTYNEDQATSSNLDRLILQQAARFFPEINAQGNVYILKLMLHHKVSTHTRAAQLINFIAEAETLRYNPQATEEDRQDLAKRIAAMK
ncbi:MAG: BatD family protein [Saprospiraceae bacterium]|nr:BatD family protein [Saprospiraceae bacterium]HMW38817.1 BatD family protein [Saprospiraceae bacterium]HMX88902.1 BatD family protein [Saprospiraceae bacterium]HMZ40307.1 BatD family protein [Saprospiraceae bacterium]HNA63339.1 BatD family protein [Saprospiraceae bacterium]